MQVDHDEMISVGSVALRVRRAGIGPPLVLLHGYPQTGACWGKVLPAFAEHFEVIVPDLRGYGGSDAPSSERGALYSKRAMAEDVVKLLSHLGHQTFRLLSHDRGARVAYRLALDHPDCVERLGIIEVIPTGDMWAEMDAELALGAFHWSFLAEPSPFPEKMIAAAPDFFLDHLLKGWNATCSLDVFAPDALAEYRAQIRDPARLHAMCEDYRAGATIDRALDEADKRAGRKIAAPLHFVWSEGGFPAKAGAPEALWKDWAAHVTTGQVDCGHFAQEEKPEEVVAAFLPFFLT